MVRGVMRVDELVRDLNEEIFEALDAAVSHTIELGAGNAKRLAPIRKVSYIERNRRTRNLTRAEVASLPASVRRSAQRIQRRGGSVLTTVRPSRQQTPAPELDFDPLSRRARGLRNPDDASSLTGRGRRELRIAQRVPATLESPGSGRRKPRSAAYTSPASIRQLRKAGDRIGSGVGAVTTLGGRLRGEIDTIPATVRGGRVIGHVISPTEYARFVEFPTSRTAAQPYMRPTLKFLKRPFVAAVHRELRRRGFRST